MNMFKSFSLVAVASALALSGCVTDPATGQQTASKTAMYGLGGAAACLVVDAIMWLRALADGRGG